MKHSNKWLYIVIGYPFIVWAAILTAQSYEAGYTIFQIADELSNALTSPFALRITDYTLPFVIGFTVAYLFVFAIYYGTKQQTRNGEEHGSAKWANVRAVCARLKDKRRENNIILTQNLRIGLNTRAHKRNLNVMVVGGSGSGKTRFFCKPSAPVRVAH